MALEKEHIPRLKEEIKLVKELGDNIGYLVLIEMAIAVYKVKDTQKNFKDKRFNVLRNHIKEILDNVGDENEDLYKLALETLSEKPVIAKK